MNILIPEPSRFFCEIDEDHFFAWLKGIDAVSNVSGSSDGLDLRVKDPIDRASFYDLAGLLSRYGLDLGCLRPLCEHNPDPWFRDQKNYWYGNVFGDAV